MRRIGIFYHPLKDAACSLAKELTVYLRNNHYAVWLCSAWKWKEARLQVEATDMVLCIGGDGTILRAAQAVLPHSVPIAGINLGRLGFMSELTVEESLEKIPLLLNGDGQTDERAVLDIGIVSPKNDTSHYYALNDVVVARGSIARLININTVIDDIPLCVIRSDGVVVSTATGSTGYSLAAGGPILHPQSHDMILKPLLPHLSFSYPMVLPASSICKLILENPTAGIASIDGHINVDLACGDSVIVKQSDARLKFIRIHNESFYHSLEKKLKGKKTGDARI